jgi:hypothetical protein
MKGDLGGQRQQRYEATTRSGVYTASNLTYSSLPAGCGTQRGGGAQRGEGAQGGKDLINQRKN